MHGLAVATYGRQVLIAPSLSDGKAQEAASYDFKQVLMCTTRGRNQDVVVGDQCQITPTSANQAVIEKVSPRANLVRRSDGYKTKSLASNVDLVAIVISGAPPASEDLLFRCLVACHAEGIEPILLLNKIDLPETLQFEQRRLAWAKDLKQTVVRISAKTEPEQTLMSLQPHFANKRVLLIGESGMGKSSVLNLLVPSAQAHTQEFSAALNAGKHTTTFARLYPCQSPNPSSAVPDFGQAQMIDTPGFQLFALAHLSSSQLMHAVPEVKAQLGQCRFSNCMHLDEPGCAVRLQAEKGAMDSVRYRLYRSLVEETQRKIRGS